MPYTEHYVSVSSILHSSKVSMLLSYWCKNHHLDELGTINHSFLSSPKFSPITADECIYVQGCMEIVTVVLVVFCIIHNLRKVTILAKKIQIVGSLPMTVPSCPHHMLVYVIVDLYVCTDATVSVCGILHHLDEWMNVFLGHFFTLSRLNWARDNLD